MCSCQPHKYKRAPAFTLVVALEVLLQPLGFSTSIDSWALWVHSLDRSLTLVKRAGIYIHGFKQSGD